MRYSKQRNEILKIVTESCDHPSAETVYFRAKRVMPNISLGTVYRNLSQLADGGLIKQIVSAYGADRYDKTLKNHSHFYCNECKTLIDIDYDLSSADVYKDILTGIGYEIEGAEIIFNGICKDCKGNKK